VRVLFLVILFSLFTFRIRTQYSQDENFPPPEEVPEIQAVRTVENIMIDGILNESAWEDAPLVDDFFRMEPRQGGDY